MEALGPSAPLSCLISIMNANVQWLVLCRVMDCAADMHQTSYIGEADG